MGDAILKDYFKTVSAMLPTVVGLARFFRLSTTRLKDVAKICSDVRRLRKECEMYAKAHAVCKACAASCEACIKDCKKVIDA